MSSDKEDLVRALQVLMRRMGEDELSVMLYLANRLISGMGRYGALDLKNDTRDWKQEQREEIADLLIYSAFEALK